MQARHVDPQRALDEASGVTVVIADGVGHWRGRAERFARHACRQGYQVEAQTARGLVITAACCAEAYNEIERTRYRSQP